MINTTVFNHQLQPFQFLSVCHYISSLGLLFSKNGFILPKEQNETIPVLNAFFEYLNNSTNETEAKRHLLQKVLNGTDLYGGGENETLDIEYIDDTFHYIISETLFSNYGGISGYVAGIINRSKIVTISILKKTVFHDFSHNYIMKDPCSLKGIWSNCNNCNNCNETIYCNKITNLTSHTIAKVFENYIWVIFPKAEADTNITDINYLYAMAGLKIAKNLPGGLSNLTFDDYVLLAHTTESMVLRNETSKSVLVSFSDPALFLYAYQSKSDFRERNLTSEFWTKAYGNLFSYFAETTQTILKTVFENSLYQKLENALSKLISRTKLASKILYLFCAKNISVSNFETMIALYKTSQWFVEHKKFGCNPNIPNLSEMFEKQFSDVRNTYKEIEKKSIELVLANGDLLSKINSPNTTVLRAEIPISSMASMSCVIILGCLLAQPQKPLDNIYFLFAIKQNGKTEFFALKQEENSLFIIPKDGNEENFDKEVGIDFLSNIAVARFTDSLKDKNENSTHFIERVASIKTDDFVKGLYNYYYEETLGEKVINGLLTLVPFYTCVQNGKDGNIRGAVLSCSLDVLSLLPLVGVATKYTTVLSRGLFVEAQKGLTVLNAGATFRMVGFLEIIQAVVRTAAANFLPRVIFTDVSVAMVRTLDPGFEAFYRVNRFGVRYCFKLYRNILLNAQRLPISVKFLDVIKSVLKGGMESKSTISDLTGMSVVGKYNDHDILRYTYPTGTHYFGPSFLNLFGMLAEMRTTSGMLEKVPVVPSKVVGNEVFYKKVNSMNGRLSHYDLKSDKNDLLHRVNNFVRHMKTGSVENRFHSYDVYHHKVEWKLTKSADSNVDVNDPSRSANLDSSEGSTGSVISRGAEGSDVPTDLVVATGADISTGSVVPKDSVVAVGSNIPTGSVVPTGSDISTGLVVPTGSVVSTGSEISTGSIVPTGSEISTGSVVPTGSDISTGSVVPTGSATPTGSIDPRPSQVPQTPTTSSHLSIIQILKQNSWTHLKQNPPEMKQLKIEFYKLSMQQMHHPWLEKPINLWFTEYKNKRNHFHFLTKMKGKRFYFNDLLPLSSNQLFEKPKLWSMDTKILYRFKIHSQNGLVNLGLVDSDLEGRFLISHHVPFTVKEVFYSGEGGNEILNVELETRALDKETWKTRALFELYWLRDLELRTPRLESIQKAADFINSNMPSDKNVQIAEKLESFYLKLEPSQSYVPTYDKLAVDFCRRFEFPKSYERWKIPKDKHIEDVLFKHELDMITELAEAENRIKILYEQFSGVSVPIAFDAYINVPFIRETLRFEDYYAIRSVSRMPLNRDEDLLDRAEAAFYRLAIRQSEQEWAKESITVYSGTWTQFESFRKYESLKLKDIITIESFQQVSKYRQVEESFLYKVKDVYTRPVFMEIKLNNQFGVADLDRVLNTGKGTHVIPAEMKFVVDEISYQKLHIKDVLVIKLHDLQISKEEKMISVIDELFYILQTGPQFYVD